MAEQKYAESRPDALHPDEPFFFLRGQDVLAPFALQGYAALLRAAAAGDQDVAHRVQGAGRFPILREQAEEVERIAAQMVAWQAEHHVKLPD